MASRLIDPHRSPNSSSRPASRRGTVSTTIPRCRPSEGPKALVAWRCRARIVRSDYAQPLIALVCSHMVASDLPEYALGSSSRRRTVRRNTRGTTDCEHGGLSTCSNVVLVYFGWFAMGAVIAPHAGSMQDSAMLCVTKVDNAVVTGRVRTGVVRHGVGSGLVGTVANS